MRTDSAKLRPRISNLSVIEHPHGGDSNKSIIEREKIGFLILTSYLETNS